MKAIWMAQKGGPEVLELRDIPTPVPAEDEVLIRIKAAGLNRSDIYSRKSAAYGEKDNPIPGLEVSGVVENVGAAVDRWKPGDQVCALTTGGGYAEYVNVPQGQCLPIPEGWSLEEAASLPEAAFTVVDNVFKRGRLQPREHLLVHGGASGIGSLAIQLATALGSAVYTTAGSDEKCRWCESLGAIKAVNYNTQDFETVLAEAGIDVVLDIAGGDFTGKNIQLLRPEGRLVFINSVRGRQAPIDISLVMQKRLFITGSMLKPRNKAFKAELGVEVERLVWPVAATGAIRPLIEARFPLEQAAAAQQLMESGIAKGKIILTIG